MLLQRGPYDSTSPSALQEACLLKQESQEIQARFIVKPKHSARIQARNQWGKVSPFPSCKCLLLALVSTPESKLMTYSRFSMYGLGGQYRQAPTPTQNQAQRNPEGLKSRPNSLLGKLFFFFLIPLGRHLPSLYPQSSPHI